MDIYVLTVYAVLTLPTGVLTTPAHVEVIPATSASVCHQHAPKVISRVRERNGDKYSYKHTCTQYVPPKEMT